MRIRKQGYHLRTADSHFLFVQGQHCLSHLKTLLHRALFGTLSTIRLIVRSDLSAFLRKSANKELFTHSEVACDAPDWERLNVSAQDALDELLHERDIAFRCRCAISGMRKLSIDHL